MVNDKQLTNIENKGEIQAVEEETKLDEHGRLIHEDQVSIKFRHPDLLFTWESVKMILEKELVPMPEIGPVMNLLEMLGEREKIVAREGHLTLPVNYFVGLWHSLNTARKFDLYNKFPKNSKKLDRITLKMAEQIDLYHRVKTHEKAEEKMADKEYFKEVSKTAPRLQFVDKKEKK